MSLEVRDRGELQRMKRFKLEELNKVRRGKKGGNVHLEGTLINT